MITQSRMKFRSFLAKGDLNRVLVAHIARGVALSMISVYVPVLLLESGQSLSFVIVFYCVAHVSGLLAALFVIVPLMRRYGVVHVFKLYYPLEIAFFVLLNFFFFTGEMMLMWIAAVLAGVGSFAYWVPHNILFLRNSKKEVMGNELSTFFALPKIFNIAGPLLAAAIVVSFGFVPMFVIASVVLLLSYTPLRAIHDDMVSLEIRLDNVFVKLWRRKRLFFMEMFDNIVEESEWFWGIFAFLIIGTLDAPGYIAAAAAIGSALFARFVGKRIDKGSASKYVMIASVGLIGLWGMRFFVDSPGTAYAVTAAASFMMAMFLISYFALILKVVKGDDEDEFIVLREIPTVVGRLIVFGAILLFVHSWDSQRLVFFVPIVAILFLIGFLIYEKRSKS
jgi:MFS family permease